VYAIWIPLDLLIKPGAAAFWFSHKHADTLARRAESEARADSQEQLVGPNSFVSRQTRGSFDEFKKILEKNGSILALSNDSYSLAFLSLHRKNSTEKHIVLKDQFNSFTSASTVFCIQILLLTFIFDALLSDDSFATVLPHNVETL